MVAQALNGMFCSPGGSGQAAHRHSQELHPEVVRYIQEELALGRSHRALAVATGVHRETIGKIAAGEHVSQLLPQRYQRCPAGHLATLPCRTCAALAERQRQQQKKTRGLVA
jgi:hypothetical protein